MKKLLLLFISIILTACCAVGTAFAAARWFDSTDLNGRADIRSWIKVAVKPEKSFAADEVYIAQFTVRQWAEGSNYKLVLSKVDFVSLSGTGTLNPNKADEMWEYYDGSEWTPISGAENLELLPNISLKKHTAYLKIKLKDGFFDEAGFYEYLNYCLELTAELISV